MSMSKKDFIALGSLVQEMRQEGDITTAGINTLANFCQVQNLLFKRDRWLDFVAGKVGPNGGAIKGAK